MSLSSVRHALVVPGAAALVTAPVCTQVRRHAVDIADAIEVRFNVSLTDKKQTP